MKRRLFNLASLASLLLCVAVGVLWVRSYGPPDTASLVRTHRTPDGGVFSFSVQLISVSGRLQLIQARYHATRPGSHYADALYRAADDTGGKISVLFVRLDRTRIPKLIDNYPIRLGPIRGLIWQRQDAAPATEFRGSTVEVDHWFPFLLSSLLPSLFAWRSLRLHRRIRAGLCLTCGYDLRASTNRCPECGAPVPPAALSPDTAPSPEPNP